MSYQPIASYPLEELRTVSVLYFTRSCLAGKDSAWPSRKAAFILPEWASYMVPDVVSVLMLAHC